MVVAPERGTGRVPLPPVDARSVSQSKEVLFWPSHARVHDLDMPIEEGSVLRRFLVVVTTLTMLLSLTAGTAFAAKPKAPPATPDAMPVDDMPHPLGSEQAALRAQGLQGYLSGHLDKHGKNGVVQVRRGKFVELDRQGEDTIWTVLGDFGTQIHPITGGTPGPVHNQIPEPDRKVDNTTIWTNDFSQAYFENLLFSSRKRAISMRNFYLEQSSGRYTVNGTVEDWVTVPCNAARATAPTTAATSSARRTWRLRQ